MLFALMSIAAGTKEILGVSTIVILPLMRAKSIAPGASFQVLLLLRLSDGWPLKASTLPAPVLRIWPVRVMLPPLLLMS